MIAPGERTGHAPDLFNTRVPAERIAALARRDDEAGDDRGARQRDRPAAGIPSRMARVGAAT